MIAVPMSASELEFVKFQADKVEAQARAIALRKGTPENWSGIFTDIMNYVMSEKIGRRRVCREGICVPYEKPKCLEKENV